MGQQKGFEDVRQAVMVATQLLHPGTVTHLQLLEEENKEWEKVNSFNYHKEEKRNIEQKPEQYLASFLDFNLETSFPGCSNFKDVQEQLRKDYLYDDSLPALILPDKSNLIRSNPWCWLEHYADW